ncbi:class I SAM-dependent methyltransferase [Novipirellula artificiosorum]|uniref:Putative S-adenosylmethionine-dependent methyltransferase n=1 Tax=Novipirellula artificiosorum TaxID=2528016 RepID=A0A5C6D2R7_9BACT|nr:class I SAM-dependent methyltransferase [Novipirellula artificiosorum]TWU29149.1 putative S-adenosylmethionine-dependent methyltransferase [Novipirellula artificiosorum]
MNMIKAATASDYDALYKDGYRQQLSGCEYARLAALKHFLSKVCRVNRDCDVLDYGAGAGLHLPLWEELFAPERIFYCDISETAASVFAQHFHERKTHYRMIRNGMADYSDESMDYVISVEVMEHVQDLDCYLRDIFRILRPGGTFVWTTPCGNRFSVEHMWSMIRGQIESTPEGYRRWTWEDPTHVRRIRTTEAADRVCSIGFESPIFRMRSHLFSFLATYTPPMYRFAAFREWLMQGDYSMFRMLPNGASMLAAAKKPQSD